MDKARKSVLATAIALTLAPGFATADSGPFIGASIGSSHLEEDFSGVNLDADSSAYRIFGGLRFANLGIEVGYLNFGDFDETVAIGPSTNRTNITPDGWTLGGTLDFPLNDQFALFGRAGVFVWDAEVSVNGFSIDMPGDENPYYGGGARVALSDSFSLVGDWTRYELDTIDSDIISIGFEYRFGN